MRSNLDAGDADFGPDTESHQRNEDMFVRPGPELIEITSEEAVGSWQAPATPQLIDDRIILSTSGPLPTILEIRPGEEPTLENFVSLLQPPPLPGFTAVASIRTMGATNEALFATTGLQSFEDGAWLWTVDRSTMDVQGALWLEGCESPGSTDVPMPIVDSTLFVPCLEGVFAVDISDLKHPKISKFWSGGSVLQLRFARAEAEADSFVAVRFGVVEYVSIDALDGVSTSTYDLPDDYRDIYGWMQRDQEIWLVSGQRRGGQGSERFPETSPTGLLTGLKVVGGELEVVEQYSIDEALENLRGSFDRAMWFDGQRTLIMVMQPARDVYERELHIIDTASQPASLVRSIDVSSVENSYKRTVAMLSYQDDLLLFRSSDRFRAPPYQRIPLSELVVD